MSVELTGCAEADAVVAKTNGVLPANKEKEAGETGFPTRTLKEITQEAIRHVEEEAIKKALFMCKWNRRKAAEMLSISYKTLFYKMRQYNLFE